MEVLQTCFAFTGKEIQQLPQTKHGKHSIDSSVSKSPLTMHSINPKSVSTTTYKKENIGGICRCFKRPRNISRRTLQVQIEG